MALLGKTFSMEDIQFFGISCPLLYRLSSYCSPPLRSFTFLQFIAANPAIPILKKPRNLTGSRDHGLEHLTLDFFAVLS